jgi:hypothetical protein
MTLSVIICIYACINSFLSCNYNILKLMLESYPYFSYGYYTYIMILLWRIMK